MPGGDGQAQHIGSAAGVVVSHPSCELSDLRGEHPLGRDDPFQRAQVTRMRALWGSVEDEPGYAPARETDADPRARLRALVQLGWDRVVEGAVEVGEADVDEDAGDVTSRLRRQPRP